MRGDANRPLRSRPTRGIGLPQPGDAGADVLLIGDRSTRGTYLLRLQVRDAIEVVFGRFRGGRAIPVPRGQYLYVGSARARKGATSLAVRLVRHGTRSAGKSPHRIRGRMIESFVREGMVPPGFVPPEAKRLRWNVDHLLDRDEVEIMQVIAVRGNKDMESALARALAKDPHTRIIERGLGAHDAPGETHLFRVEGNARWWEDLVARILMLVGTKRAPGS